MNLKDFNKIIKLDPEDVKVAIDRYYTSNNSSSDSKEGKRKVGENSDWIVYHVTTFPAAQELGEGTEWCITGRYGNMDPNDDRYFKNYIQDHNLDGGYYFYIPKNKSNDKHCLLLTKNGKIDSVWGTPNGQVYDVGGLNFPEVKGIDLDTIVACANKILKEHGSLCMVHRTDRLIDVITAFKKYGIEPKRIKYIHENIDKESTLFLIEGQKAGSVGLKIDKPLILYNLEHHKMCLYK